MNLWDEIDSEQVSPDLDTTQTPQPTPQANNVWDVVDAPPVLETRGGAPLQAPPSGGKHDVGFMTDVKAAFSDDPMARFKAISEKEKIPLTSFGKVHGKEGYLDPKTQEWVEINDSILSNVKQFGADVAADMATTEAGALTGMAAGSSLGLPGTIMGGGLGALIGSYGKQKTGEAITGDPVNYGSMAIDTGIGLFSSGIGGAFAKRKLAKDLSKIDNPTSRDLRDSAERLGITLTEAEISGLPSLINEQRFLNKSFLSSDIMGGMYDKRGVEIHTALNDWLDAMALDKSALEGNVDAINAAKKHIDNLKQARTDAAKPLYKQAETGERIDVSSLVQSIDDNISKAGKTVRTKLKSLRRDLFREEKLEDGTVSKVLLDDYESLHNRLKDFQDDIETARRAGKNQAANEMTAIKEQFVDSIAEQSASFKSARQTFSEMSGPIEKAEEGTIGMLSRIKEDAAQKASRLILSPNNATPNSVLKARITLSKIDPQAWKGLVVANVRDQLIKMPDSLDSSASLGGAIRRSVLGTKQKQDIMRAAMSKEEFAGFNDLMDVLDASSRAARNGSDTAIWQSTEADMKDEASGVARKFFRGLLNPLSIPSKVDEALQDRAYEKYAVGLAEAIVDPKKQKELKRLRSLSDKPEIFVPLAVSWFNQNLFGAVPSGLVTVGTDAPLKSDADFLKYAQQNVER